MSVGIREILEFTLPLKATKKVAPGDFFRVEREGSTLVLRPFSAIDPEQAWFWTTEWQRKEREAEEDIRTGHISGPFRTVAEFMSGLKRTR